MQPIKNENFKNYWEFSYQIGLEDLNLCALFTIDGVALSDRLSVHMIHKKVFEGLTKYK